jgi:hypothetical protein
MGLQSTQPASQPAYPPLPDEKKTPEAILTYNCAGLAFRNFRFMGDRDEVAKILKDKGRPLKDCSEKCGKCEVKLWFWSYDLHIETDDGRKGPTNGDFHIVGGQASCTDGSDPTDVISKNGQRPLEGLGGGMLGGHFRPKDREEIGVTNDGHRVFKVRANMKEQCYCMKTSDLPK